MGPGRDRTLSPCICSQTCICKSDTLSSALRDPLKVLSHEMNVSSGVSKVNSIYVYIRPKHFLYSVNLTTLIFWGFLFMPQRNFGRHIVIALSVRPSVPLRVRFISPLFFEVGIPILVCGYILGWQNVAYPFRVTVTLNLTSDLVFRIIVSGAYLLYYLR